MWKSGQQNKISSQFLGKKWLGQQDRREKSVKEFFNPKNNPNHFCIYYIHLFLFNEKESCREEL